MASTNKSKTKLHGNKNRGKMRNKTAKNKQVGAKEQEPPKDECSNLKN